MVLSSGGRLLFQFQWTVAAYLFMRICKEFWSHQRLLNSGDQEALKISLIVSGLVYWPGDYPTLLPKASSTLSETMLKYFEPFYCQS